MSRLNLILWLLSLTLQSLLFVALFSRRIVRVLPAFAVLLSFYILRSLALVTFAAHLHGPFSSLIYSGLALIDLLLQVIVAWELYSLATRASAPPRPIAATALRRLPAAGLSLTRRLTVFLSFLLAAAAGAFLIARRIHANPYAPMDRGVLFAGVLFLLIFVAVLSQRRSVLVRLMGAGFALYATAAIVSQTARTLTAAQRDAVAFHRWSYLEPVTYLAIVLSWLLLLPRQAIPRQHVQWTDEERSKGGPRRGRPQRHRHRHSPHPLPRPRLQSRVQHDDPASWWTGRYHARRLSALGPLHPLRRQPGR